MSLRIGHRAAILAVCMLGGMSTVAVAQISIGIGLPSVSIGISVPFYPNLIPIPGYPVYYDPRLDSNLFFYDGVYWAYAQDNWYASTWYDGPWDLISAEAVPDFVLRIPVRYYRRPPPYFLGWDREAPPRWGEHWGRDWEDRRRGWDHWDRASIPRRAPLPTYQREYSRDRYPHVDQQQALRERNYHYHPREDVVRGHFEQPPGHAQPNRPPTEHQRPNAPPPNVPRGNAPPAPGHPPAGERHNVPAPPAPGHPPTRERHNVPAPPPPGHPPARERHNVPAPPPPGRDAHDTHRAQPDHPVPQHDNPQTPQQQRPAERAVPPRDSHPPQPRTDKPPG